MEMDSTGAVTCHWCVLGGGYSAHHRIMLFFRGCCAFIVSNFPGVAPASVLCHLSKPKQVQFLAVFDAGAHVSAASPFALTDHQFSHGTLSRQAFLTPNPMYSVFYTYGLNLSNDSILVAIIMHATINTFGGQIPWNDNSFLDAPNSIQTVLMVPAVLLLLVCTGPTLGRAAN
jgi:hypothetical protein